MQGAALAYYTLFSLAPLLLIVVAVAGLIFGQDAARGEIATQLSALMGVAGAKAVQDLLSSVGKPVEGSVATAVGLLMVLVGSTTVFAELQDSLDRIWRVPVRESGYGWLTLVRTRLLSFGMILAIGFLLIVSLVMSAVLNATGHWLQPLFGGWYALAAVVNSIGSFLLLTAMFALIYKVMPRARVDWNDVWTGAVFTATLFTFGNVSDRSVHWSQRRDHGFWGGGFPGRRPALGLLLGPDFSNRCRIHLGLRQHVWLAAANCCNEWCIGCRCARSSMRLAEGVLANVVSVHRVGDLGRPHP
jgi:YihY family inner membrane protein